MSKKASSTRTRKPNLPSDTEWCDSTLKWYKAWKNSTRTDNWDAAQWQYLFDTAMVHQLAYTTFNPVSLSELRKREAFMGLAFEQPVIKKEVIVETKESRVDKYKKNRANRKSAAED